MVRPQAYDDYNFNQYPLGTNAIVAVISYTGYVTATPLSNYPELYIIAYAREFL